MTMSNIFVTFLTRITFRSVFIIVSLLFLGCSNQENNPVGNNSISNHWVEVFPALEGNQYQGVCFINSDTGGRLATKG